MIDCSLLTYKDSAYLLPTIAISEAIILPAGFPLSRQSSIVGTYNWSEENRPILTLDLLPPNVAPIKNPKIAFLHNTLPKRKYPFFAVLFEGQTRRIKILPENITWIDESKKRAIVAEKRAQTEVCIVDLTELSNEVELTYRDIQIAK
jgi:hypothetical protein